MNECIFCKIINKEIPAKIVYEDEEFIAFDDINPVAPVHILIIPKKHIVSLNDINNENYLKIGKIFLIINKLVEERKIKEKGYRVVVNCGKDGGQEVGHLHFHLIGGEKLGIKMA